MHYCTDGAHGGSEHGTEADNCPRHGAVGEAPYLKKKDRRRRPWNTQNGHPSRTYRYPSLSMRLNLAAWHKSNLSAPSSKKGHVA